MAPWQPGTGRPLLEITRLRAALPPACLSRLLVNRMAPPRICSLQHLPARVITAEDAADAQSDRSAGAFPPIEGTDAQATTTIPLNIAQEWEAVVWHRYHMDCRWIDSVWYDEHTPNPCATLQLRHIYCASCRINCGVCAPWCDKRSQEIERLPPLKVKYSRNIFTLEVVLREY